ncbi:hypothetical protein CVV65_14595 [Kyrpidia spormannii]|uniref:Type I restriction modification DNA specificity domain-containing protein n=1 Tax=Kyrpidia spormannii TaxID=2055160 RepID=A0A2K8N9M9_9BACL|nr:restriction endonuclease subunit S [Kyrpidia spormannii]ATY86003.1 hypothetical protein CVV65_14595 [Kyrpidia spormannii]
MTENYMSRMTDILKPYPAYKDSGVEWLGQVPEHWEVLPGRAVFREINDRGHPDEQMLSVTITRGVLRQADLLANSSKKDSSNEDKSNYKLVQPGDLVYNKMRAWQGAVGVSAYRGIVSPAYIVQRLRSVENLPRYMHFLLRTPLFASEAERWSYGITSDQWSLRAEEFKCIYFSLPPLPEQTAIVRFLEWAERKIRRVIRARQRRINLLEEYKQALIHQAVTGQIDVRTGQPYPAYKDSGVEWLGKVPAHWELRKLRALFTKAGSGTTPSGEEFYGSDIPWVVTGDLNDSVLTNTTRAVNARALETFSALRLYPKDSLIVAMYGATIGKTAILGIEACTNQACCVLAEPRRGVLVRFIQSAVIAAKGYLVRQGYGGGQPNINSEIVHSLRIPVPPYREQTAIAEYLDAQSAKIDAAISAARREIELLHEYLERLIVDVVTGKVDVREVAARLPEEPPEEESEWGDTEDMAEAETADDDAAAEALAEEEVEI